MFYDPATEPSGMRTTYNSLSPFADDGGEDGRWGNGRLSEKGIRAQISYEIELVRTKVMATMSGPV
jgi:hypothetical protein